MNNSIKPIFIFSLPRAGSTLLQRILASHTQIASTSEPWILLPLFSGLRKDCIMADYGHLIANQAVNEFVLSLPSGISSYYTTMKKAALELYGLASNGEMYFLDKTPRYHLIIDQIASIFPDSKFIFLWRNPLAIASSIVTTFGKNRWKLFKYHIDIYQGQLNLIDGWRKYKDKSISIKYEDLVIDTNKVLVNAFDFLELTYNEKIVNLSSTAFKGKMGDPTGVKEYKTISQDPINKWSTIMSTPVRKRWCKHYLEWIGRDNIEEMRYCYENIIYDISKIKINKYFCYDDVLLMTYGFFYNLLEMHAINNNFKALLRGKPISNHI